MSNYDVICVLGNRGCGKSRVCQWINSQQGNGNIIAIESGDPSASSYGFDSNLINQLVFEHPFEDEIFKNTILPDRTSANQRIYWIILDCDVDTILKRIPTALKQDVWYTRKALHYYQQRYRQLGAHFGIPFLDITNSAIEEISHEIFSIIRNDSNFYEHYRRIGTQILTYDIIEKHDIENQLHSIIRLDEIPNLPEYAHEFTNIDQRKLYTKWYVNNQSCEINSERSILRCGEYDLPITGPIFKLTTEGESKKIYKEISGNPLTKNLAFIVLKSTIYSHSKQITGEINSLGSIRACGSQLFLEMMWRNGLKHAYRSISAHGIIVSDFVKEISPMEIIVKRYCEGTDKNSYYGILTNENIVSPRTNGEYRSGPYVRFDWRNPNHISPNTKQALNENIYYYIYEQSLGKEEFFKKILADKQYAIPMGDKNISEDLLTDVIHLKQTKLAVLKMFMVIQSYFSRVNFLIKDVCFMLNRTGEQFWSEINQDCMRITMKDEKQTKFDKDIWRIGGSKSREQILQKWTDFNEMFKEYFRKNRFHQTELFDLNSYFYQEEIHRLLTDADLRIPKHLQDLWLNIQGKTSRRVLVTMDMFNGQPVLVKSSQVCEIHSSGDYLKAMEKLAIFPDILVVDLNGAFGEIDTANRRIIKQLALKYHVHTGGGLRTIEDLEEMLNSGIRRCVMASGEDSLFEKIPKDRLIVEISVNEKNEVLIHGRRTNTHVNILTRLHQLIDVGVRVISITFVQTEGHLSGIPRQQVRELISQIPYDIEKIYIAGGVSSLDDLDYLWSFPRIIPVLGSAIWKNKLTIGQIYNRMLYFDESGLVPAIIQDINGSVKGLVYMNEKSIEKTCENRVLYRYSRKLQRVIMKGEMSGDQQQIIQLSVDCDSDALLITVDSHKPFCHTGNHSCFNVQTSLKGNFAILADHIKSRMSTDSYTGKIQRNPSLALVKIMEELWEIVACHHDNQIDECSDMIAHLIMYLNGMGISIEDICNELNRRRWMARGLTTPMIEQKPKEIIIGITSSKYTDKTDRFAEEELGIRIRRQSGRNFYVSGQIIDRDKFSKYFHSDANFQITLFSSKPKDMIWLLAAKRLTHIITFDPVVKNYPKTYATVHEIVDPTICLALVCRSGESIEPAKWTKTNKVLIASEYICQTTRFLEEHHIHRHTYHIDKISGASEAFLVNTKKYLLADTIVESGRTLKQNQLEIWNVIVPRGEIRIGLYEYIFAKNE
ncbi:unnamed protein product [Adineta ricciae]|uniref:Phosphoribosyl-AMP cyclohydrolase n=3 Tax=Adineta ricciae TaxID=249248 RepID=A0A815PPG4_ADIRI|nr:unnamed protein product [Adineta ricciae]